MLSSELKQKLFCYVDETGQDTKGKLFIVALVITADNVEPLREALERIEQASRAGALKWTKTSPARRAAYLQLVIENPLFKDVVRYAVYSAGTNYQELTTEATAKAILDKAEADYDASVFIDGLGKPERYAVAVGLRKRGVRVGKVRGLKDEADPLIRLADAMAGFVRLTLSGDQTMQGLYEQAMQAGVMKKLE